MKIAELFSLIRQNSLGIDGKALLLAISVIPTTKSSKFVVMGNREIIITPRIQTADKFTVFDKTVSIADVIAIAGLGAMLSWPKRLELYAYATAQVLENRGVSDIQAILALLFDGMVIEYAIRRAYETQPIEAFAKDYIKEKLDEAIEAIQDTNLIDIFGFTEQLYNKKFRSFGGAVTQGSLPPHIAINRVFPGSSGAGAGTGGVEQSFVANLIHPHVAKYMEKIRALSRAFSEEQESKYDYDMNPPDFTYWEEYEIILSDWHKIEETKKKGIFFLVDTSGSVSDFELQLFVNEVYSAAMKYRLTGELVWFSGGVEGVVPLKDITRPELTIKGRGGTELAPALAYVKQRAKELKLDEAAVVVLSDGGIFDADAVVNLGMVTNGPHIFFYTAEPVGFPGWIVEHFE